MPFPGENGAYLSLAQPLEKLSPAKGWDTYHSNPEKIEPKIETTRLKISRTLPEW